MTNNETDATIVLNCVQEIGPARFQSLLNTFGTALEAIHQGVDSWITAPLFDVNVLSRIKEKIVAAQSQLGREWSLIEKSKTRIYLIQNNNYPRLLREIANAPPILYVKGEDISVERPSVALVGSRKCSYYGEKMAVLLTTGLAARGITTVSGLARGIDTQVHQATVRSSGKTWAVIGSGLNALYPPENKNLAKQIEETGAIISEFPMMTQPFPGNFPRRNRIIAGLTLGTVLIEGGDKSGSLITARLAAEEGREVFAVPGPATSELSVAPHRLLQMGATMVQSAEDILMGLGIEILKGKSHQVSKEKSIDDLEQDQEKILEFLGAEPISKEILAQRLNKEARQVSSLLLDLELRGLIRSVSGGGVLKT